MANEAEISRVPSLIKVQSLPMNMRLFAGGARKQQALLLSEEKGGNPHSIQNFACTYEGKMYGHAGAPIFKVRGPIHNGVGIEN